MKFFLAIPRRKYAAWVILELLAMGLFNGEVLSQQVTPSFKITGAKRMEVYQGSVNQRAVEYDPYSSDHLIISYFGPKDLLREKSQYLFKGKKFNHADIQDYLLKKELLKDGIHQIFSKDQKLVAEMIFKNDTLREQTLFYPNGQKQMTFEGDEKALNGEFIMWHPNGQISFLGRYHNNLKNGEFECFDEAGHSERKGVYEMGKLISGESVVQDLLYDAPEVRAQFMEGEKALNDYLQTKTENLPAVKEMVEGIIFDFNLFLTIDKKGQIKKMEIAPDLDPSQIDVINSAFRKFPPFKPALMEGAPVRSILKQHLFLSHNGLQVNPELEEGDKKLLEDTVYFEVEEMPEFPGGDMAIRMFLAKTIRYPMEAAQAGIMGKSFVSFVIDKEGKVINVAIARSAHPLLDAEAIRVVQSMPRWKPAYQNGKAVKVKYTMPINFVLE